MTTMLTKAQARELAAFPFPAPREFLCVDAQSPHDADMNGASGSEVSSVFFDGSTFRAMVPEPPPPDSGGGSTDLPLTLGPDTDPVMTVDKNATNQGGKVVIRGGKANAGINDKPLEIWDEDPAGSHHPMRVWAYGVTSGGPGLQLQSEDENDFANFSDNKVRFNRGFSSDYAFELWSTGTIKAFFPRTRAGDPEPTLGLANEAFSALYLKSPNGTVYAVTVDDSGNLVTTPA